MFRPRLGNLQANILHKINYNCMLKSYSDSLRSQCMLKTLKYVVIQYNAKIIAILEVPDLLRYLT